MNEEKMAFMAKMTNYCYKVMPFGLKNARTTYQHLMEKILYLMIERNIQAYVDDMLVTSVSLESHRSNLEEIFTTIVTINLNSA